MSFLKECPNCGETNLSWIDARFGHCKRAGPPPRIAHSVQNDGFDYREDLARFPNDPQARVDGPRALQKLKDQRQREGWTFSKVDTARPVTPPTDPNRSFGREAYEAARAKGFNINPTED